MTDKPTWEVVLELGRDRTGSTHVISTPDSVLIELDRGGERPTNIAVRAPELRNQEE